MFSLFKKNKTDVAKLHQQYRDKKINQNEYSDGFYLALCEYLISDEIRKKMEKAGIDIVDPQEEFTPHCDTKTLIEIESDLWTALQAIGYLNDAVSDIKPNEKYDWPSQQYQGKSIVSHKEWAKYREQVTARTIPDSFSVEIIYGTIICGHLSTIKLLSHSMVLSYMSQLFGGATIA